MQPEGSLPHSQELANCRCHESQQSRLCLSIPLLGHQF